MLGTSSGIDAEVRGELQSIANEIRLCDTIVARGELFTQQEHSLFALACGLGRTSFRRNCGWRLSCA